MSIKRLHKFCASVRKFEAADDLAPTGATVSAGTVMNKFGFHILSATEGNIYALDID